MERSKILAVAAAGALVAALALAGCGGTQSASSSTTSASGSASAASAEASASNAATSEASASASAAASEAASAAPAASASAPAASGESYIGEGAAIDIALSDAGFSADAVRELKAELDTDDSRIHYDVEFKNGNMEYDYDIDAVTGEILEANSEIDD